MPYKILWIVKYDDVYEKTLNHKALCRTKGDFTILIINEQISYLNKFSYDNMLI